MRAPARAWSRSWKSTQTKGDGETHPFLSPNDEFANFERWDDGNLDLSVAKTPEMLEFEYARSALKNGLKLEAQLGVNPYKYGMIGSTDAHTSLAAVEENNFFGKLPHHEPSAGRATHPLAKFGDKVVMGWEVVSSGYAAVWATENTREAIFDAMKRKEVYATTGPRMLVRLFGGWDFVDADANTRKPGGRRLRQGRSDGWRPPACAGGQGADLPGRCARRTRSAPTSTATRSSRAGWTRQGELHEKVYDVVWSGDRKPGADGKLPPVGNTVDVAERHVDEHDRRAGADHRLDRP